MCTQTEIKPKRNYREELLIKLEASQDRLINAVNKFNISKSVTPINRAELELFPYMVWVEINDKIQVRKRKNRFKTLLNFDTKMQKGAEFGEHFHNDIIESAEVIRGKMVDLADNKIYKEGDVAHYEKGEKHTPIATEETLLHVLFK